MGCFSWAKHTELNWLFRAFALSRSLIIGWSFTRSGDATLLKVIIHLFKTGYFLMLILLLEILKGVW